MKTNYDYGGFGIAIAFLAPGFIALWGASYHSGTIGGWLSISQSNAPTVGGFMYATLGSLGAGVTISAIRWLLIDIIICALFKAKKYHLDFGNLPAKESAFFFVNENHYRYYQYYANMLVALAIGYLLRFFGTYLLTGRFWNTREAVLLCGLILTEVFLGIGAWDSRRKFYQRAEAILSKKERLGKS